MELSVRVIRLVCVEGGWRNASCYERGSLLGFPGQVAAETNGVWAIRASSRMNLQALVVERATFTVAAELRVPRRRAGGGGRGWWRRSGGAALSCHHQLGIAAGRRAA